VREEKGRTFPNNALFLTGRLPVKIGRIVKAGRKGEGKKDVKSAWREGGQSATRATAGRGFGPESGPSVVGRRGQS